MGIAVSLQGALPLLPLADYNKHIVVVVLEREKLGEILREIAEAVVTHFFERIAVCHKPLAYARGAVYSRIGELPFYYTINSLFFFKCKHNFPFKNQMFSSVSCVSSVSGTS